MARPFPLFLVILAAIALRIPSHAQPVPGTYATLINFPGATSLKAIGYLRIQVSRTGSFTGVLYWRGRGFQLVGKVDEAGTFERDLVNRLGDRVHLGLTLGEGQIGGSVEDDESAGSFSGLGRGRSPAFRVTGTLSNANDAYVQGFLVGTVASTGQVRLCGRLPAGWPFSIAAQYDSSGRFHVYQRAFSSASAPIIWGELMIPSSGDPGPTDALRYSQTKLTPGYSDDDDLALLFDWGIYRPPALGQTTIPWGAGAGNARVTFKKIVPRQDFTIPVTFFGNDYLRYAPRNDVQVLGFTTNRANGLFWGAIFTRSLGFRTFTGTFVQPWRYAGGQFATPHGMGNICFDSLREP